MSKKNDKLNLSGYTPEEIAKRMLETPPPPEKQVAKRKREEEEIDDGKETNG